MNGMVSERECELDGAAARCQDAVDATVPLRPAPGSEKHWKVLVELELKLAAGEVEGRAVFDDGEDRLSGRSSTYVRGDDIESARYRATSEALSSLARSVLARREAKRWRSV